VDSADEERALCPSTLIGSLVPIKCASPNCKYLVHSRRDYGQFCCGTCWCRHTGIAHGRSAHGDTCERREACYDTPSATYEPSPNEMELIRRTSISLATRHNKRLFPSTPYTIDHDTMLNGWSHSLVLTTTEPSISRTQPLLSTCPCSWEQSQNVQLPGNIHAVQLQSQAHPLPPPPPPRSLSLPADPGITHSRLDEEQRHDLRANAEACDKSGEVQQGVMMSQFTTDCTDAQHSTQEVFGRGHSEGKVATASALWLDTGLEDPTKTMTPAEHSPNATTPETTSPRCLAASTTTLSIWARLKS